MDSRDIFKIICVLVLGLSFTAHLYADEIAKPNIVLIYADDMGWGDVGYHGFEDIATPNIDALAAAGIQFSQGYVSASVCGPSRAGLMTGVYQQRFGCGENSPERGYPNEIKSQEAGLPYGQPILPEMIKPAGYRSAAIGKWHLGLSENKRPLRRGFDEFYGFLNGAHSYYKSEMEFTSNHSTWPIFRNNERVKFDGYLTDVFTDKAVDFIRRNKENPFFLYLSYNAVHSPWEVDDSYIKRVSHIPGKNRCLFAAMVLAMDDGVGRVVQTLKEEGLGEKTIVMFISDNGTPQGQRRRGRVNNPEDNMSSAGGFRGFKGDTYEGGIRVPFIFKWPDKLTGGRCYDLPVSTLDITPTILAAIGLEKPRKGFAFDGVDLMPYLTGKNLSRPHEIMYWRRDGDYAIRKGDLKLAWNDGNPTGKKKIELFDLNKDKYEKNDLSAERPEAVKKLQEIFDSWDSKLPDNAFWGGPHNRKRD